ncbi:MULTISPECIES: hypothetical protein [Pseudomonas]|uniref:SGNH hydrolase-type esterase domain-containing protein n=1 Tax=Pseudomonas asplenii TaxID=53407 RepID=A0A0M9GGE5_9PSED|nr:hypothetical protein [Pseudomonas fuscovaginae]KPA90280.1 hypothetical protein PF66_03414 [Pseudomonas fuscovaginae]KPA96471.1 hypothetical protein PF70_03493 [Pseudomonas fuscovaginae]
MKTPYSTTTPSPSFLLLGDSNAGPIGKAAQARGLMACGGPLGAGRDFNVDFLVAQPGDVGFRDTEMDQRYRQALELAGVARLEELSVPLVSTLGMSVHFLASRPNWHCYQDESGEFDAGFLGGPLFESIIEEMSRYALAFYERVLGLGIRVLVVLPPQRVPEFSDARVFIAAQEVLIRRLRELGVELIDVRDAANGEDGWQAPRFCEIDDPLHGNLAFGELIVEALLPRLAQPQWA